MKKDKETDKQETVENQTLEQNPRSSAFNEQSTKDQKSTFNIEEEAGLEQERKEATTERD